ncbi:DgyrCDS4853 [Dimorphilus gyrociliatus]|uniref:DgyrCDS4853 n=1 Tax=Dimorphilus gyrociliatus TaxID=2664684 RepID=A0A7I8VHZ2_9ANNE|nr:DgyrCDS4853 [Dimorphilus gyrociliatus]
MDGLSYFTTQGRLEPIGRSDEDRVMTHPSDSNRKHVTFNDIPAIVVQGDNDNTGPSVVKKEKLALCISSVMNMGRELGVVDTVKLCMYLNVPTTKLVKDTVSACEKEQEDEEFAANMLLYWRTMRASAKDRDKARELERGLRSIGREELADFFMEKYQEDIDLLLLYFAQSMMSEEIELSKIASILNAAFPQGINDLGNAEKCLEINRNKRNELQKEVESLQNEYPDLLNEVENTEQSEEVRLARQRKLFFENRQSYMDTLTRVIEFRQVKLSNNIRCSYLVEFMNDCILHWYKMIKERFSLLMEEPLKYYGWPKVIKQIEEKLPANPEWYLTQTLNWIKDHRDFMRETIQPIFDRSGLKNISAVNELSRGLVLQAMEKLAGDVDELMYDEYNFAHMIDEVLSFDKELRRNFAYPFSQPSMVTVIATQSVNSKWLLLESKFAKEKMDKMLSSETAWISSYKDVENIDEGKVPECAENFMNLMLTMTDRYKSVDNMSVKLKFASLQLQLLDDFRIRLIQIKAQIDNNPVSGQMCAILNTVFYVSQVLKEWSDLMFFQDIHEENCRRNALKNVFNQEENNSIFDGIIDLFERLVNDMTSACVSHVIDDVRNISKPYRHVNWITLKSVKEYNINPSLSVSACETLLVLKEHLHNMNDLLNRTVFEKFWINVAEELDIYFFENLIMVNRFNEGGALQLQFDMTRNLFPLFGQYTMKPENFLKRIKESCIILTLSKGTCLSLIESIQIGNFRDVLKELSVNKLKVEDVKLVINLRTDVAI